MILKRLIIFASGAGSNAQAIIDFFKEEGGAEVVLIVSNKPQAGVLDAAQREMIPSIVITAHDLAQTDFIETLQARQASLIVLAGFLLKIPAAFIEAFRGKVVNIHPALLPKYGGKGMWGRNVHEAVIAAGDARSGISIHLVDEEYDHGATLLQATCPVIPNQPATTLAARVQKLEHFWYPRAIQHLLELLDQPA